MPLLTFKNKYFNNILRGLCLNPLKHCAALPHETLRQKIPEIVKKKKTLKRDDMMAFFPIAARDFAFNCNRADIKKEMS